MALVTRLKKAMQVSKEITNEEIVASLDRLSGAIDAIDDPAVRAFVKAVMARVAQLKAQQEQHIEIKEV